MKTAFLSQTLTDILDEDEEDSFVNISTQMSQSDVSLNISSAINDLFDPEKRLPPLNEESQQKSLMTTANNDYDAIEHLATNDDAWNEKMNKPQPKEKLIAPKTTFKKKM